MWPQGRRTYDTVLYVMEAWRGCWEMLGASGITPFSSVSKGLCLLHLHPKMGFQEMIVSTAGAGLNKTCVSNYLDGTAYNKHQ